MRQGADVDALDALGREMAACAETIEGVLGRLSSRLSSVPWTGPDADGFRHHWTTTVRTDLRESADTLREAGAQVRRQAEDQRQASAGTGAAGFAGPAATLLATGRPPVPWLQGRDAAPWRPLPGADPRSTVQLARRLGVGIAPTVGVTTPAPPVEQTMDAAMRALVHDPEAGHSLLAGGRWGLGAQPPGHPGALVAGIVATQPWDPAAPVVGWGEVSILGGPDLPIGAPAPVVHPTWELVDRSVGRVADPSALVEDLW